MPATGTTKADRPILALCLEYPIFQHGGTEVLVRELIRGFSARYRLVLVSDDDPRVVAEPLLRGRIERHLRWVPRAGPGRARELAHHLSEAGVNLAHFHFGGTYGWGSPRWNGSPIVHLAKLGVPCLSTNHGVFWLLDGYIGPQRSLATKMAFLPFAWACRLHVLFHLRAEVAVSRADYRTLRRRYWPARSRFRWIYHSRLHENAAAPPVAREKIVLCAGTVGPRKGQGFLVQAFRSIAARFPDWKLVLVGRPGVPGAREDLERLIDGFPQVSWLRDCSNDELAAWYQRADIFAMPSLHEGLGLTLQEALFYECACVASRAGGIVDLIKEGDNGLLVPAGDAAPLAQALETLMRDEGLRARLRARARSSVLEKGMTIERMVRNYASLYDQVLRAGAAAAP